MDMGRPWPFSVVWDLFTAAVGVYYWTLRRAYGVLLGRGAIYLDPEGKQVLDEAGARERAARDVAEAPVVYMSGYSNGLLGTTRILDDDITFLEKPFSASPLLTKIADALTAPAANRPAG